MRHRLIIERAIVRVDHDDYGQERKARGKRLKRMRDERAPGAAEILLRPVRAEPLPPTAGDDHKPDLIR
jgi:hypothetical protein